MSKIGTLNITSSGTTVRFFGKLMEAKFHYKKEVGYPFNDQMCPGEASCKICQKLEVIPGIWTVTKIAGIVLETKYMKWKLLYLNPSLFSEIANDMLNSGITKEKIEAGEGVNVCLQKTGNTVSHVLIPESNVIYDPDDLPKRLHDIKSAVEDMQKESVWQLSHRKVWFDTMNTTGSAYAVLDDGSYYRTSALNNPIRINSGTPTPGVSLQNIAEATSWGRPMGPIIEQPINRQRLAQLAELADITRREQIADEFRIMARNRDRMIVESTIQEDRPLEKDKDKNKKKDEYPYELDNDRFDNI